MRLVECLRSEKMIVGDFGDVNKVVKVIAEPRLELGLASHGVGHNLAHADGVAGAKGRSE